MEIPEEGSGSKGDTYKKLRTYIQKFKEKTVPCICRELKGVETGKVLCSARSVSPMRLLLQKNILRKTDNLIK